MIYFNYISPLVHSALLLILESFQNPLPIILKLLACAGSPSKAPSLGIASLSMSANLKPPFHSDPPWRPTSLNHLYLTHKLCLSPLFCQLKCHILPICHILPMLLFKLKVCNVNLMYSLGRPYHYLSGRHKVFIFLCRLKYGCYIGVIEYLYKCFWCLDI